MRERFWELIYASMERSRRQAAAQRLNIVEYVVSTFLVEAFRKFIFNINIIEYYDSRIFKIFSCEIKFAF